MNSDSGMYFFYAIITLVLTIVVMYQIIYSANRSRKKLKYLEAQIKLLSQTALNNSVSQEKISEILKEAGK